jgi:LysM repeat protein
MKSSKQLILFLLLNVLISACTISAVLVIWDQFYGPMPRGLLPNALRIVSAKPTGTKQAEEAGIPQVYATPTEEFFIYQVQEGDTFESIAKEFEVTVEELVKVNGFNASQLLGTGEVLRIPVHVGANVVISSVIGAGDLESEHLVLKQDGEGELSLVGWRLEDEQQHIFIFPQFPQMILYKDGAVNIYSKSGSNSVIELFWGLNEPVWQSGETAVLRDPQGDVRATYKVP